MTGRRPSKSEAIRLLAKDDTSITNNELKRLVFDLYGLRVSTCEIINQIGAYRDRRFSGRVGQLKLGLARDYLKKIGTLKEAVSLLHLADT